MPCEGQYLFISCCVCIVIHLNPTASHCSLRILALYEQNQLQPLLLSCHIEEIAGKDPIHPQPNSQDGLGRNYIVSVDESGDLYIICVSYPRRILEVSCLKRQHPTWV